MALKHVGRIAANKRKVVVAYRTIPGEPENCLVVTTENLDAADHDSLMKLVESDAGQQEEEFDGRIMLSGFHTTGKMTKVPTNSVEMTPDRNTGIMLDELNKIIAEQKGVAIEDLAMRAPEASPAQTEESTIATASEVPASSTPDNILSDEDLAAQYRSQADAMFKEAKRLREQAEELVPTKKKVAKASA
jgi:hypothetical protein